MIRSYDAWVLRRLLVGYPLNGELGTLADPFGRLADYLRGLSPEGCPAAWDAYLCGPVDRDERVAALAAADPDGPPPEPETVRRRGGPGGIRRRPVVEARGGRRPSLPARSGAER